MALLSFLLFVRQQRMTHAQSGVKDDSVTVSDYFPGGVSDLGHPSLILRWHTQRGRIPLRLQVNYFRRLLYRLQTRQISLGVVKTLYTGAATAAAKD